MTPPVLGINCNLVRQEGDRFSRLNLLYVEAVRAAGGAPLLLPFFRTRREVETVLDRIDGLLLTGGGDIHPSRWGGRRAHPKADLIEREKEESDFLAASAAVRRGLPVLGICLGSQILNVALGGSIHQHLPDLPGISAAHRRNGTLHDVSVEAGSGLAHILGTIRPRVNSYHHQAVDRPGRGLRVVARAPDGVIEGLEGEDRQFLLAVQWHPERMQDRPEQRRLFSSLVSASRRRRPRP